MLRCSGWPEPEAMTQSGRRGRRRARLKRVAASCVRQMVRNSRACMHAQIASVKRIKCDSAFECAEPSEHGSADPRYALTDNGLRYLSREFTAQRHCKLFYAPPPQVCITVASCAPRTTAGAGERERQLYPGCTAYRRYSKGLIFATQDSVRPPAARAQRLPRHRRTLLPSAP